MHARPAHAAHDSAAMRTTVPRHSSGKGVGVQGGGVGIGGVGGGGGIMGPHLLGHHRTLGGMGQGRGRRKKRWPVLAILAAFMMLWVLSPAIHHIVMGFHKVVIRSMFFSIERPKHCPPSTPVGLCAALHDAHWSAMYREPMT